MNTLSLGFKYFFVDLVGGMLRWPIWWYTKGLVGTVRWAGNAVGGYAKQLAIRVWIKNIFVPMYGTRDFQSRIISFFMRSVQIFARGFVLLLWFFVVLLIVAAYIALPIVSVIGFLLHMSAIVI